MSRIGCSIALVVTSICAAAFAGNMSEEREPSQNRPAVAYTGGQYQLSFDGHSPIRVSQETISDATLTRIGRSDTSIATWYEGVGSDRVPYFSYSRDGVTYSSPMPTSYEIHLDSGTFEPLLGTSPALSAVRADGAGGNLYLVQLVATGIDACNEAIESAGGEILSYVPENTYIVKMDSNVRSVVENLPIVRWVGTFDSSYRIADEVTRHLTLRAGDSGFGKYRICLANRKNAFVATEVADAIRLLGGVVDYTPDAGSVLVASLTPEQVTQVAGLDGVLYIDLHGEPIACMNIARSIGGANTLESVAGYTGDGVRGEVMDDGCQTTHPAFSSRLTVRLSAGVESHGTSTTGIVFGDGAGSSTGRGMLPDGDAVFSQWTSYGRYSATAPLVTSTWHCVFQSNSWHTGNLTWSYNSTAEELDDIVFDMDLLILQAQGNYGTTGAARECWAKNILSVGAVSHYNTLTKSDDAWTDASIGPCDDGRIKPDLCHFYDYIRCPTTGSSYTSYFGGTSGATPIVAGHAGLMFQMWADGIFGNPVSGGTVFQERPHSSTARALLINTADPYPFSGTSANLTRTHQGWGLPNVQNLYDRRNNMLVVDETDILHVSESMLYARSINSGNTEDLRVTLVWTDPPGTGSASRDRINNLDLRVTSPSGVVYYGNEGLDGGNYSTSGGSFDVVNTLENVFIADPEVGNWEVEVIATSIGQDGHTETGTLDVDYGLVISGGTSCPGPVVNEQPSDVSDCAGTTVVFSASSEEAGVSYRWQKNGTDLTDEVGHISGASTDTLTIEGIDTEDVAGYRCKVTNDCAPSFSRTASLSLASGPSVTTQPQNLDKCAGDVTSLVVIANGKSPLSYQWEKDGEPITGATDYYFTIDETTMAHGGVYRCKVINDCGEVYSDDATLTVLDAPTIVGQPEDTCAEPGETATFSVSLEGTPPYYYMWSHDGNVISSSNTDTLEITNVDASDAGLYSVVLVSYSAPDCEVYSESAELQVGDCGGTIPECTNEVLGDIDDDGDVDLADFGIFQSCFGADGAFTPGCECANLDTTNADIDLTDYLFFESLLSGPQE